MTDKPTITAYIQIGSLSNNDISAQEKVRFALVQPQIHRILKTLEITSDFNQFKDDVVNKIISGKVTQHEKERYIKDYEHIKDMEELKASAEDIKKYKDGFMTTFENNTTYDVITELRQVILNKEAVKMGVKKETDIIKAKIDEEYY